MENLRNVRDGLKSKIIDVVNFTKANQLVVLGEYNEDLIIIFRYKLDELLEFFNNFQVIQNDIFELLDPQDDDAMADFELNSQEIEDVFYPTQVRVKRFLDFWSHRKEKWKPSMVDKIYVPDEMLLDHHTCKEKVLSELTSPSKSAIDVNIENVGADDPYNLIQSTQSSNDSNTLTQSMQSTKVDSEGVQNQPKPTIEDVGADKYSVQSFQLNESIKSSAKDFEFNQSMPITNFVGADKFKIVSQDRTNCRKWRQEPDMLSTDVYNECKIVEPKPNKYHQVCRVWTILPSADYSMEQYSKKLHAVPSTVHSCVVHSQQLTSGSNKTNDLRPFVDNEEYGLYNVSNRKNSHFFKLQPKSRSQIGSSRRKSCVFSKVFGFYKKRKLKVKKNRSDSRKERHISRLRLELHSRVINFIL